MKGKIKFGVVGCGKAGENHIKELKKVSNAEIMAICDIRPDIAREVAQKYQIKKYYTDYKLLFSKEDLDAVAVITSADTHFPIVLDALNNGLDVICEKPLTVEPNDSWTLVKKAKEKKRILAVTFTYHFTKDTRRIKEIIDKGTIGKIIEIRFAVLSSGEEFGKPPKISKKIEMEKKQWENHLFTKAKGIIFDCGIHAFNLFSWYAKSEVKRIKAIGTSYLGYSYPDAATAIFEFNNGIKAVYDYGKLPHFRFDKDKNLSDSYFWIIVSGEKGSLIWRYANEYVKDEFMSTLKIYTFSGIKKETFPLYSKERILQYKQFIESIKKRKLIGYFPSPEEAAKSTEIASKVVDILLENLIRIK